MPRRGYAMIEAITALGLALSLIVTFAVTLRSQIGEVRVTSDWLRAREALVDAGERLRAGALAPPAAGETRTLRAPDGLRLTCARLAAVDPRLAHPELIPVRLRVEWTDPDGQALKREHTLLVRRRP